MRNSDAFASVTRFAPEQLTMNYNLLRPSGTDFDAARFADELLRRNPVLSKKVCSALNCMSDEVPNALCEVLRFMFLVVHSEAGQLTPSRRVDLAWHEFILCTKAYQDFCNEHFGKMIHHFPGGPQEVHRRQFETTLQHYEHFFGVPSQQYWGQRLDDINCGACEAL